MKLKNVFIHDNANTLKNLTANKSKNTQTTIISQKGDCD